MRPPATLVRRYDGRLVDISTAGCLLEIAAPLTLGAVGRLEALIDGAVHAEAVRVARINPGTADGVSQVGLEFLVVSPAGLSSIRTAIQRLTAGADAVIKFAH